MLFSVAQKTLTYRQNHTDIIYLDEIGFVSSAHRPYGWSKIGQRIYAEQDADACNEVRTSLIGVYHNKKLIAPLLFEGCCNAALFDLWLENIYCRLSQRAAYWYWTMQYFIANRAVPCLLERQAVLYFFCHRIPRI